MDKNDEKARETCPGISNFIRPKPEYIPCVNCGSSVEIWTDEEETDCPNCGAKVSRKVQSCLDYCEYAEECKKIIAERKR
jgi:DNA-directed RNA polymerase subunit RPC12/RpoP